MEEIIAENFPNLLKDTNLQIQESEQTANDKNLKKSLLIKLNTIIKLLETKDKEKTLKEARGK